MSDLTSEEFELLGDWWIAGEDFETDWGVGTLAPIVARIVASRECAADKRARLAERERISAALNAVMRWRIPHPTPAADGFDYMLLLDDVRQALAPPTEVRICERCGERIVWNEGNGGQWLGAEPPRDWVNCFGRPEGEPHRAESCDGRPGGAA